MPKVELHLHLEGAIRPQTALELMQRNKAPHLPDEAEKVRDIYKFDNLGKFVAGMRAVSDNIRNLEDLQRITVELLESLIRQNVRYVEFDCALQKYIDLGFDLQDVIAAIYESAFAFEKEYPIKSKLSVNLQRAHGPDSTLKLVEDISKINHPYVVSIGLSGDETKYPQGLFADTFRRARELGLHRTAHAGEGVGPESVWSAINDLQVERIDHGTRARDDERLVEFIIERQIPLTQCLTSNKKLQVIDELKNHPFGDFFRRGMMVTLNTDDPQVFGTELQREFNLAATLFDLSRSDLAKIVLNAANASFLSYEDKKVLVDELTAEFNILLQEE